MITNIIRNINLFVDGRGYAGQIEEITLPKLTPTLQEYKAGGMSAPIDIPMGSHEKMEADFTLKSFDPEILKLFKVNFGSDVPFTARGAVQTDTGETIAVVVSMQGIVKEFDMGTWKAADEVKLKVSMSLRYYKLEYNGEVLIESDPVNMRLIINGEDQLAQTRAALGM